MTEARILIVEDDAIMAHDLKNGLTGMGYFIVFITPRVKKQFCSPVSTGPM